MALIVYPAPDFNTYVSLTHADTIAETYLSFTSWEVLTDEVKTRYLYQAFRTIKGLPGFVGPVDPEPVGCLAEAQVQIALNDVTHGISTTTEVSQQVKKEKAGPVEMEYYENASGVYVPSIIPKESYTCLQEAGWVGTQSLPGMGTIRKYR